MDYTKTTKCNSLLILICCKITDYFVVRSLTLFIFPCCDKFQCFTVKVATNFPAWEGIFQGPVRVLCFIFPLRLILCFSDPHK